MTIPRVLTTTMLASLALGAVTAMAQTESGDQADYCQQGFSLADTDRDEYVSPEEASAAIDWEFSGLDANDDGMISQTEWLDCRRAWISATAAEEGSSSPMPEIPDMALVDEDGDGKISQEEFMNAASGAFDAATGGVSDMQSTSAESASTTGEDEMAASGDAQMGEPLLILRRMVFMPTGHDGDPWSRMGREEMANRAAMQFVILDTNRDRSVDTDEWDAQESTLQNDISEVLNMQFEQADTDASGDISREEYEAAGQKRMEQAQQAAEEAGEGSEVGAPVVYYTYPHVM